MKKLLIIFIILCAAGLTAFALESSKPETHNDAWGVLHGKKARVSESECITCHTDRLECITCHEDTKPRSHNATWTMKSHGQESRWNRNACKTCHTEDSCMECHETYEPVSHNVPGFGPSTGGSVHCQTSCNLGAGTWKNTMSKDCLVCHKTLPSPLHPKP